MNLTPQRWRSKSRLDRRASADDRGPQPSLRIKAHALRHEPGQKRRRCPLLQLKALAQPLDRGMHVGEPDLIGAEHRAATPSRKAVAVKPHHVDVDRLHRYLLAEDLCAFVDNAVEKALQDLLIVDSAAHGRGT